LEFRTAERDREKTRAYVRDVIPDAAAALKRGSPQNSEKIVR
jgi:hypothetical protein